MDKKNNMDRIIGMTAALGATAMLTNTMFGGMNKMFGMNETPKELARDMMAGATDGILLHFDCKMDEYKREIEHLKDKVHKLEIEKKSMQETMDMLSEALENENKMKADASKKSESAKKGWETRRKKK